MNQACDPVLRNYLLYVLLLGQALLRDQELAIAHVARAETIALGSAALNAATTKLLKEVHHPERYERAVEIFDRPYLALELLDCCTRNI